MKTWDKGIRLHDGVGAFTVGKDRDIDLKIAVYDVLGSIAHVMMLESVGLLDARESEALVTELRKIHSTIVTGRFVIEDDTEDVHSQLENMLTGALGDAGKKVHTGRSRNDQVLLDIQLLIRDELYEILTRTRKLFDVLIRRSDETKGVFLPGYTHLQTAMPSSFGLWFGAYAEALADDVVSLSSAWKAANQNPLGSGAGYGTSLPLNRRVTTELLAFEDLRYNAINAQMMRGKIEYITAAAISVISTTLGRYATDVCLYNSQNFSFVSLPETFTTGSSIMPHKKNPDVFELVRGKCNRIRALPGDIGMVAANLPSGYHRDFQLIKELLFPALEEVSSMLDILVAATEHMKVNNRIGDGGRYAEVFSVEEVNRLVMEGMPFRDAYRKVAGSVSEGKYRRGEPARYTHEGSTGNLCNEEIKRKMAEYAGDMDHAVVEKAYDALLGKS